MKKIVIALFKMHNLQVATDKLALILWSVRRKCNVLITPQDQHVLGNLSRLRFGLFVHVITEISAIPIDGTAYGEGIVAHPHAPETTVQLISRGADLKH